MKALVLSAGAARCAYQCGVLQHLLGDLHIHYDIITGVSAGAINAAFVAMYKIGEEVLCANDLLTLWKSLTTKSIYRTWKFWGRLAAMWKTSLFDSTPLHNLIKNNISLEKIRNSGKKVSVGTVSLSSGKYGLFTQSSDHFVDAVLASSAFPGLLAPVQIGDQLWLDGGTKEIAPLKTALDLGATEIDVILTYPKKRNLYYIDNPNILDILNRVSDLSVDKIMSNDLEKLLIYNKLSEAGLSDKKVVKINIIRPDNNLVQDSFQFDQREISKMIDIGFNDAVEHFSKTDDI